MAYVLNQRRRCSCGCGQTPCCQNSLLRQTGYQTGSLTERAAIDPRVLDPFYRGPCGTQCEISSCCQTNDFYPTYGYFTQAASINAPAGGSIPMNGTYTISPTGIGREGDMIYVTQAGVYRISFAVRIPADVALDSTFSLYVGGVAVPGASMRVVKTTGNTALAVADAIVTIDAASQVSIITSSALSFNSTDSIATLTLHRIA